MAPVLLLMRLEVVEGDIAALEVDAIANAANDRLWMGAGVAGALKRAGGDEIEREAVTKAPIGLGEAVATGAGRLQAKHIIHGAVMGQDLRTNADLVRKTTRSCLELADELGASSLALPAFGTGVGAFPLDECARIMVDEARAYEPKSLDQVVFAVFGEQAREAFERSLAAASNPRRVDPPFQTDARAEPTHPESGIASDASAETAHELAEAIASAEAVPASGWVAGVAAGLAAALVAKTAARSEGWGAAEGARAQALDLRDRLLALAGQDAQAYEHALTALEQRDSGLARALSRAADVPLAIAETSADVALLAADAAEAADGSARADAAAAASLAAGAALAAAKLVEVNLATVEGDERLLRAGRAAEAATEASNRAFGSEV